MSAGTEAAEDPGVDGRWGHLAVLRDRNFWPFFVGNLLSNCGTWFQNIAQTLFVYRLTGSIFLVSLVNFSQFVGVFVVGPLAGVVADRYDRRTILLVSQSFAATLTFGLAWASANGRATVPVVIAVALGIGLANAFSVPPMLAMVPQLVPEERLGSAIALNVVTFNGARAIGPVLGAIVVERFGTTTAFAVNGLSFVSLIVALVVVRPLVSADTPAPRASERPRLLEAVKRIAGDPRLRVLLLCGAAVSLAIDPVVTLSPAIATDVLGRPDTLVGWMVGVFGAGAVLGALTVAGRTASSGRALLLLLMLVPVTFATFAFSTSFPAVMVTLFVAGFAYLGAVTGVLTRLQLAVPTSEHGRLMAVWSMVFMGSRPIGSLLDGVIASRFGLRAAILVVAAPAAVMAARARMFAVGRR